MQKGFSLIELMVVIAIIGILAAVGIPQYSKFQAKTRQSEAKSILVGLFHAEKTFYLEWLTYTVDLRNAGFGVEGKKLRYAAGFAAGAACTGYPTLNSPPTEITTAANTWSDSVTLSPDANWVFPITKTISGAATACASQTFNAAAIGDPSDAKTSTPTDQWNITDGKQLTNTYHNW